MPLSTSALRDQKIAAAKSRCADAIPFLIALWTNGRVFYNGPDSDLSLWQRHLADFFAIETVGRNSLLTPLDLVISELPILSGDTDQWSPANVIHLAGIPAELREILSDAKRSPVELGFDETAYGPHVHSKPNDEKPIRKPALFLDRDGTVIKLVPYITDPGQVALMDGIVDLIRWAKQKNYAIVCVTNQSGIGREYYTWEQFQKVQDRMDELLLEQGILLNASLAAGYFSESKPAYGYIAPALRKPFPGMLVWSSKLWNFDLANSIMIGDSEVDVGAGERAGCAHVFQISQTQSLADILLRLQKI